MLKNTAIAICVLAAADASKLTGRHSQSLKMKLRNRMGESQTGTTADATKQDSTYYDAAYSYYSNYDADKGQYYSKGPTSKFYSSYDSVSGDSNGYYEGKYSYSYDYTDNVYSYQGGYQYYDGGKGAWWSKSVEDQDNKWGYDQTEYNFSGGYSDTDGSAYY